MKTQAPPTAGPPGPWNEHEVGEGEDVPYRPTDAKSCRLAHDARGAGPGSVLGLCVEGRSAARISEATWCAPTSGASTIERGRAGKCYGRIDRRCVQPVFLGRCRTHDDFFRRRVAGYRCTERRLYPIRADTTPT